ncbi:MAG: alpha/beta hydrolase [Natronosporangium sp.]
METDILGPPYQQLTIDLGSDEEGPVVATLVRRRAPEPTRRAVLWVHGWSDYFFQTHVADHFTATGFDFYALDLRKYGRSLRRHQTPNYCRSLAEYLPELDVAARWIRVEDGHDTLLVAGHSTGALVTALWAHQRRAARLVDAMFFNSPFFDLNLPAMLRAPAGVTAARLARRSPYGILRRPAYPVYGQSLHVSLRGEWSYDLAWKPVGGFPIRFGWLAAIQAGQRRLHAGLSIDVPVLVACSTRSYRGLRWHELARRADAVLDVADMVRWAPQLGRHVTLLRVNGGMHDLTLSAPAVRAALFSELSRWAAAYAAGGPPAPVVPAGTPDAPARRRTPPTGDAGAPAAPG